MDGPLRGLEFLKQRGGEPPRIELPEPDVEPCPCGRQGCFNWVRDGVVVGGFGPAGCPL